MASKLPKLLLPAYDFKSKPVAYYAYAEAVYKGRREAMIKETVDKAWVSAVKDNYPKNQAKREELIKQVNCIHPIRIPRILNQFN